VEQRVGTRTAARGVVPAFASELVAAVASQQPIIALASVELVTA
jgi:hypothetical protein